MNIQTARPARRMLLTVAVAGMAMFSSVTLAPAASAAPSPEGQSYVIDGPGKKNGHGPDAFIVDENGKREPVFFCDADKPKKQHNICVTPAVEGGPRF